MITLVDQVKHTPRVWPTPARRDFRSPGHESSYLRRKGVRQQALNEEVAWGDMSPKTGGRLNPEWVEWLMGFPLKWTDIDDKEHLLDKPLSNPDGTWIDEPANLYRTTSVIKNRTSRIKCLGNAVVPQVAEFIGKLIVKVHDSHSA